MRKDSHDEYQGACHWATTQGVTVRSTLRSGTRMGQQQSYMSTGLRSSGARGTARAAVHFGTTSKELQTHVMIALQQRQNNSSRAGARLTVHYHSLARHCPFTRLHTTAAPP